VREGGQIAVGDSVFVPRSAPVAAPTAAFPVPPINHAHRLFICRGCYFIYEEANGLPQQSIKAGTQFADFPATWRCPDCGTDKSTFKPYVEKAAAS
jgi:GntR family transcriptional regulator/MocR family aminotransferase